MLKNPNKKRIKIIILVLFIIFTIIYIPQKYIWGSYVPYTKRIFEPTQIFEIDNTSFMRYYEESGIIYIEKQYMIIKPPKNLKELKLLIEKYENENSIDFDMVKDEIKNKHNITDNEIKKISVFIRFYREKRNFPRDWQPVGGHMSADRLEHHGDACIASISYSDVEQSKEYTVMKKKRDGKVVEEIVYINDKIIKHEINEVD